MNRTQPPAPANQQGIALATSLIFLVVITLLGLVGVRSSTTELRLARNEQVRIEALEKAQAAVDAVTADPANLPVTADASYMRCFDSGDEGGTQDQCAAADSGLALNPTVSDDAANPGLFEHGIYAEVRRLEPEMTPPTGAVLTSMDKFSSASFSVRGQYSRGQLGLGSADIEEGLIKLVPRRNRIH